MRAQLIINSEKLYKSSKTDFRNAVKIKATNKYSVNNLLGSSNL